MHGEGRRILVGNLQAKAAGFFKISAELPRPPAFSLSMIVMLVNPRSMEFVNDRVKVVVRYGKKAKKKKGSNLLSIVGDLSDIRQCHGSATSHSVPRSCLSRHEPWRLLAPSLYR